MQDFEKSNIYHLPPEIIQLSQNGRVDFESYNYGHTDEEIDEMVKSFEDNGQLQPIKVRKHGTKMTLVLGFRRYLASIKYNKKHPEKKMSLICLVSENLSEEQAFLENIDENKVRKQVSPIDDAHNQNILRDIHGWSEKRIADYYKQTITQIHNNRKLLNLTKDIQLAIHTKRITVQSALGLSDLNEEEQAQIFSAVKEDDEKEGLQPDRKQMSKRIVEKTREVKSKKVDVKVKNIPRSIKEIRSFCEEISGNKDELPNVRLYHEKFIEFMMGRINDESLCDFIDKCFEKQQDEDDVVQQEDVTNNDQEDDVVQQEDVTNNDQEDGVEYESEEEREIAKMIAMEENFSL